MIAVARFVAASMPFMDMHYLITSSACANKSASRHGPGYGVGVAADTVPRP